MRGLQLPRLHVVTDDDVLRREDFAHTASELLQVGGADIALHVRGPRSTGAHLFRLTAALVPAAAGSGAGLLVNDRADVALAAGAHGVHLGQRSLPVSDALRLLPGDALVGVSTHSAGEVREAAGAHYLFVGHVFATPSHPGIAGRGVGAVAEAATSGTPVVAIGGVGPHAVAGLVEAGAYGVAVMRGIWDAPHPLDATMRYLDALRQTRGTS